MHRYGDLTVFKMLAVRCLGFLKFNFFTVKESILRHRTKFHKDQSNHCGDVAIFVIFKMAPPPSWIFKNSKL